MIIADVKGFAGSGGARPAGGRGQGKAARADGNGATGLAQSIGHGFQAVAFFQAQMRDIMYAGGAPGVRRRGQHGRRQVRAVSHVQR